MSLGQRTSVTWRDVWYRGQAGIVLPASGHLLRLHQRPAPGAIARRLDLSRVLGFQPRTTANLLTVRPIPARRRPPPRLAPTPTRPRSPSLPAALRRRAEASGPESARSPPARWRRPAAGGRSNRQAPLGQLLAAPRPFRRHVRSTCQPFARPARSQASGPPLHCRPLPAAPRDRTPAIHCHLPPSERRRSPSLTSQAGRPPRRGAEPSGSLREPQQRVAGRLPAAAPGAASSRAQAGGGDMPHQFESGVFSEAQRS